MIGAVSMPELLLISLYLLNLQIVDLIRKREMVRTGFHQKEHINLMTTVALFEGINRIP